MKKRWLARRLLTEHAFDKLRAIDCSFREFEVACEDADVIETIDLESGAKELLVTLAWVRPLHVVVIVDHVHDEDRILTIYEPDSSLWSADFRTRR